MERALEVRRIFSAKGERRCCKIWAIMGPTTFRRTAAASKPRIWPKKARRAAVWPGIPRERVAAPKRGIKWPQGGSGVGTLKIFLAAARKALPCVRLELFAT